MSKTTVQTPTFRMSYPALFEAKLNDQNGKMEYSVVALFAKGEDLSALKAAAQAAIAKKWPDKTKRPKNLKTPFRDQADRAKEDAEGREVLPAGYEKGAIFITLKSKERPGLVDKTGKRIITDETELYSGCYARALVNAYAYEVKGNAGVAFGLQHVQKVRDGEPLSGRVRPEEAFTPIEGADEESTADDLGFDEV